MHMIQVYDSERVKNMGDDGGYMGSFSSMKKAQQYAKDFAHLFEGYPVYKEVEDE